MTPHPGRIVRRVLEPPSIAGKVPPHDLEAEAAVLSALLLDGRKLDEIATFLKAEDFYSEANANTFDAIVSLGQAGEEIDTVQVASWLAHRGRLASIGGAAYLAHVVDATPKIGHVRKHAERVLETKALREIAALMHTKLGELYGDHGDPRAWMSSLIGEVERTVRTPDNADRVEHISAPLARAWTAVNERLQNGRGFTGLSTGLSDLDRLLGGLRPGDYMTIGARAHVGKSSLARQIAMYTAGINRPRNERSGVLMWSGEQLEEECAEAMSFQLAGVSQAKIRNIGKATPADWESLTTASKLIHESSIFIRCRPGLSPLGLRALIREWKQDCAKMGVPADLVIVDYIQLMGAAGLVERNANREREVAAISGKLKETALSEKVAMVVCAQLNKDGDSRKGDDARPRPSDLRESNRLEQDPDKIVLIHNPNAVKRMHAKRNGEKAQLPEQEVVELIVGKARGGGTMGTAEVLFFPQHAEFANLATDSHDSHSYGRTEDAEW